MFFSTSTNSIYDSHRVRIDIFTNLCKFVEQVKLMNGIVKTYNFNFFLNFFLNYSTFWKFNDSTKMISEKFTAG